MIASPRIGGKQLARLCYQLGTSLQAGVDIRKALANESERGSAVHQRQVHRVSDRIASGATLAESATAAGGYFPPLFLEMTKIGEETGHLDAVLMRLAEHYEGRLKLRRIFLAGIAWPLLQLGAAILVIGLLIWILGMIGGADILGFGLTGASGVIKYFAFVAVVGLTVALVVRGAMRGWFWTRPIQKWIMKTPVVGQSLRTIAISRIAWTMSLTFNSEMDAGRAIQLALASSENTLFTDHADDIARRIARGDSVCASLRGAGVFPVEFLDALDVGEGSGRLAESMAHLADQYRDRATEAFRVLTVVAGFAVWGLVATLLIFMIFRLAMSYFGMIDDALNGKF